MDEDENLMKKGIRICDKKMFKQISLEEFKRMMETW